MSLLVGRTYIIDGNIVHPLPRRGSGIHERAQDGRLGSTAPCRAIRLPNCASCASRLVTREWLSVEIREAERADEGQECDVAEIAGRLGRGQRRDLVAVFAPGGDLDAGAPGDRARLVERDVSEGDGKPRHDERNA